MIGRLRMHGSAGEAWRIVSVPSNDSRLTGPSPRFPRGSQHTAESAPRWILASWPGSELFVQAHGDPQSSCCRRAGHRSRGVIEDMPQRQRSACVSTHAVFSSHIHTKGTRSYNAVGQIGCSRTLLFVARADRWARCNERATTALRCTSVDGRERDPAGGSASRRTPVLRAGQLCGISSPKTNIPVHCTRSTQRALRVQLRSPTASGANVFRASCAVHAFVDRCVPARGMPLALSSGNRTQRYVA